MHMHKYRLGFYLACLVLVVIFLLCKVSTAFLITQPKTLEEHLTHFLQSEKINGAVIAYGAMGSKPTVLAIGYANSPHSMPHREMRVDDQFRLASLAKPITAAAILKLVEEKRISLETNVPGAGAGITIRHLLQHSGGWDRAISFDPISDPQAIRRIGITPPYSCEDVAKRMPPSEFKPGTKYAYSNIGYCWLGKVIEDTSGISYAAYVEHNILLPRHVSLTYNGQPTVEHSSDWPNSAYQALGPGGGWTGTASDYWRFAASDLIDERVTERPIYAVPGKNYYGFGWRVWPDGTLSHFGAIPGVYSVVIRKDNHVAVILFNGRPSNDEKAFQQIRDMVKIVGI